MTKGNTKKYNEDIAKLNDLLYILRYNISYWPVTMSICSFCHEKPARGGGKCRDCAFLELCCLIGEHHPVKKYLDVQFQITDLEFIRDIQKEYPDINNPVHVAGRESAGVFTNLSPQHQIKAAYAEREKIYLEMSSRLKEKYLDCSQRCSK